MRNELPSRREVINAAWREFKITKAVAGDATEPMLGAARAPGSFVDVELGFGLGEAPSIMATLDGVARATSRGWRLRGDRSMERPPAPPPRPKQRESARDRHGRLQELLRGHVRAA